MTQRNPSDITSGFIAATAAFIGWGLLPIYWKALITVDPFEILCHRIIWSLIFIGIILTIKKRWPETFAPLRSPRNLAILSMSSLTIGTNWLIYIWAVNNNHVLDTSLGYYINPLVNMLFGFIFFRERMNRLQILAVLLAAIGVVNSIVAYGHLPWISLVLAVSFACYGLLRKIAAVESLPGLFLETLVLTPAVCIYLWHIHTTRGLDFGHGDMTVTALLIGAGVATAMPLIGFAYGARRLQLTTLGLLQYTAPSITFMLGVFLYHEPFGSRQLITFALIWCGLAIYTGDSLRTIRRQRKIASGIH